MMKVVTEDYAVYMIRDTGDGLWLDYMGRHVDLPCAETFGTEREAHEHLLHPAERRLQIVRVRFTKTATFAREPEADADPRS